MTPIAHTYLMNLNTEALDHPLLSVYIEPLSTDEANSGAYCAEAWLLSSTCPKGSPDLYLILYLASQYVVPPSYCQSIQTLPVPLEGQPDFHTFHQAFLQN